MGFILPLADKRIRRTRKKITMRKIGKNVFYTIFIEPIKERDYIVASLVVLLSLVIVSVAVVMGLIIHDLIQEAETKDATVTSIEHPSNDRPATHLSLNVSGEVYRITTLRSFKLRKGDSLKVNITKGYFINECNIKTK